MARRSLGLGHERCREMNHPPPGTGSGAHSRAAPWHLPTPMGSISHIPVAGCRAQGPVPGSGLVPLLYKTLGLGGTKAGCRGHPKAWGLSEQQGGHPLPFLREKEGAGAGPQKWRGRASGQTALLAPAQQIRGMWTPKSPSPPQGQVVAHYTACVRWGNDENQHLSALKPFFPLLILSIASENHWCSRPRKASEGAQPQARFLVLPPAPISRNLPSVSLSLDALGC